MKGLPDPPKGYVVDGFDRVNDGEMYFSSIEWRVWKGQRSVGTYPIAKKILVKKGLVRLKKTGMLVLRTGEQSGVVVDTGKSESWNLYDFYSVFTFISNPDEWENCD